MNFNKIVLALTIITLAACEEKGPVIDFGNITKEDTTYVTTPEVPQPKNILVEEFTGVSCPPCPSGHEQMKAIKAQHGERIMIIAYHIFNFPQAEPIKNLSKQDFRTEDATTVGNTVFGSVSAMPVAGIDRMPEGTELLLGKGNWAAAISKRMTISTPVNLYLNCGYNDSKKEAVLKVKTAFTENVGKKLNLTIAVIEDGITDAQKNQLTIDSFYTHNYVLRDIVTHTNGLAILDNLNPKIKGTVYERTIKFNISNNWNAEQCKIIAFISSSEGADKEVLQATLVKLKQ